MAKIILMANQVAIREWTLELERLSVGRARSNDIHLDDPAVSSHHAAILWMAGTAFVQDLGSTNGTLLNGEPVQRACCATAMTSPSAPSSCAEEGKPRGRRASGTNRGIAARIHCHHPHSRTDPSGPWRKHQPSPRPGPFRC